MLPALSRHYHLTPVDVLSMSANELAEYQADLDRMAREQKKSNQRAKRGGRRRRR